MEELRTERKLKNQTHKWVIVHKWVSLSAKKQQQQKPHLRDMFEIFFQSKNNLQR